MKYFLILSTLLGPLLLGAQDRSYEFTIRCKILDSNILSVEDGISKRYGYFTNGYRTGDYIRLKFEQKYWDNLGAYNLFINDLRDKSKIAASVGSEDFKRYLDDVLVFDSNISEIFLSNNLIQVDGLGGEFRATRFYKDDWQAIYTHSYDSSSHIMSLSCLGVTSKFNSLIRRLEDLHPN